MGWYGRLRNLWRQDIVVREIQRELEFHLAERVDDLMAEGMGEEEARREARRRFGNPVVHRERTRDVDMLGWLESLGGDMRYALRALRASPGFALAALLSLGLGIGANTAIFSLIDAILLRPLPVSRPEQLMQVNLGRPRADEFSNPLWQELRARQEVFSGTLAYAGERFDLSTGGESRPIDGAWVSGGYFATLGVLPVVGRLLQPSDDRPDCPPVVVLGGGFWRTAYGGDPGVVGQTITLSGHAFEVLGVAKAGFSGTDVGRAEQVFVPLCAKGIIDGGDGGLSQPGYWFLHVMGRRRPGLSGATVRKRLAELAPAVFRATLPDWGAERQRHYLDNTLSAEPAATGRSDLRTRYGLALMALMGVVALVLVIACGNLANLLLVRATARRREMAVRIAIGAGRARLVRQLLTESALIALLGAATGLLFAAWSSRLLVRMLSTGANPVWLDLKTDGRILSFTLAVTALTSALFGLAPAWHAVRIEPQRALSGRSHGGGRGRDRGRGRGFGAGKALVIGQLALSMVLVVTATLLLGTFRRLRTLDLGFNPHGVLLIALHPMDPPSPERGAALQHEVLQRLRGLPGVRSASVSMLTPISGAAWNGTVTANGYRAGTRSDSTAWINAVSSEYFATMGTRLLGGRDFGAEDRAGSATVGIVSESLAKRDFGTTDPIGRRLRFENPTPVEVQIVGVVQDAKYRSLREEERPTLYLPITQIPDVPLSFEVRARVSAASLVRPVTTMLKRVAPGSVFQLRTLSRQVSSSLLRERLLATLSGFFGGLALLLAGLGLYGTIAYSVLRRRSEIGIRVALGAVRPRVIGMVLGDVARLVIPGVLAGALLSLPAARLISALLYGLRAFDPRVLFASALTLATIAFAAGLLPAIRAARVDPAVTLRAE